MQCGFLRFAWAFPRRPRVCDVEAMARALLFIGMALLVWIALAVAYVWRCVALYRAGWPGTPRPGDTRIVLRDGADELRRSG
jgi:hypothetical protein